MFGNAFIKLAHPNMKGQVEMDANAMKAAMLGSTMSMSVFCFMLSVLRPTSGGEGGLWGVAVALLFDAGLNLSHHIFEERPFALFAMHVGYHAFSLLTVGSILGAICN